jgi:acyl-CoA thioesterase FadM
MAFIYTFPVVFEEVDYARVVHFPHLFSYCHRTFEALFPAELGLTYAQAIEERKLGFPFVHAEGDFQEPFRLSDPVRVELTFVKLSERSFTHRYRLSRGSGSRPAAEVRLVTVVTSMPDLRPMALPDDLRAAITRHLVQEG